MTEVLHNAVCVMTERGLSLHDALRHEGETFLIVLWYVNQTEGRRLPKYVMPLSSVEHQTFDPPVAPHNYSFFVNDPLPASIFLGPVSPKEREKHGIHEGPEVTFPFSTASH